MFDVGKIMAVEMFNNPPPPVRLINLFQLP